MKIKTVYTCELCGTSYSDKNKAEECEKTHKTGLKIVKSGYLPYEHNAKGFPSWILVMSKAGEEAKYRR